MGKPLDFDPLNVQIRDLRLGFFVDYNFKTYEITAGSEVQMKDYSFRVMKMDAADEIFWMMVENGTDTAVVETVDASLVDSDIPMLMQNFGKAPSRITYKEIEYSCISQGDGKFRDLTKNAMDWNRTTCWKYIGNGGNNLLYVVQKGVSTFEAIVAVKVAPSDFSNFLPKM
jgi:hypothetical protein